MFLYNPAIMIPCFSESDLHFFEKKLGIHVCNSYEESQRQLVAFRMQHHSKMDNYEFMVNLYNKFGKDKTRKEKDLDSYTDYELNRVLITKKIPIDSYITAKVEKPKPKKTKSGLHYYSRDPKMALYASKNANFTCENDATHRCFIKRNSGVPYTEVHHLIPICFQEQFDYSLDVPENIVSLCSNCHNEIHYGKDADDLIRKLFKQREYKLRSAGIEINVDCLVELYHKINKKK